MYVNSISTNLAKNSIDMVRKTKEDAEITRQRIVQAAREMFLTRGVSRTSLEQIANHAGVTRGAVYWHFENKAELFYAMREQVFLPLIDRMEDIFHLQEEGPANPIDPLERIEHFMKATIQVLEKDTTTRQTYEIMMSKCEYVEEFATVLQQILNNCSSIISKLSEMYSRALKKELIDSQLSALELAMDTHLFFSGLLHMWVKDTESIRFRHQANVLIEKHILLRRKIKK